MHWTTVDSFRLHSWDEVCRLFGEYQDNVFWSDERKIMATIQHAMLGGGNALHLILKIQQRHYETNDSWYMHWEIIEKNLPPDRWQWTKKVPNNLQHWNPVCVEELDQHLIWSLQRLVFFLVSFELVVLFTGGCIKTGLLLVIGRFGPLATPVRGSGL